MKRAALVLIGAVALTLTGCAAGTPPLQAAAHECTNAGIKVLDEGHALKFDMRGEPEDPDNYVIGETDESGTGSVEGAACLLNAVKVPESVIAKMDSTRALDGTQSQTFDHYEITWSYHPDQGLDFIIEEVPA